MKNIYLLGVLLMSLFITSCGEFEEVVYDNVNGQTYATFDKSNITIPTSLEGATQSVNVVVSTLADSDRKFVVEVDESSTATADQYQLSGDVVSGKQYKGALSISPVFDALPNDGEVLLVLNLKSFDGKDLVETSQVKVKMFKKCPSDLAGDWAYFNSNGNFKLTTITKVDDITYKVLGDGYFSANYGFTFVDKCNKLELTQSDIIDRFGIATSATGTHDPETGVISFTYNVDGYADNYVMNLRRVQ